MNVTVIPQRHGGVNVMSKMEVGRFELIQQENMHTGHQVLKGKGFKRIEFNVAFLHRGKFRQYILHEDGTLVDISNGL